MATINTAEDLIRILRQDPEILDQVRRAILTDELLELPVKFAEMAEAQARMAEAQARMAEAQTRMAETQAGILQTQAQMIERQQRMEDRIGYLVGAELERKVFRILPTRLNQIYGLRRTRIVLRQGDFTPDTQKFLDDIDEALESSLITEQQRDRLVLTDLVVRASKREGQSEIYFAVEASGAIAHRDIDRAVAASEALHALYEVETIPVAAGYRIHQADQSYANQVAVRTIILEEEAL